MAKMGALVALALILNHARCVAACIADPCDQRQAPKQPSCHHHKTPEPKADRGCAFPAVNDAQSAAATSGKAQPAVTAAVLTQSSVLPPTPAPQQISFDNLSPGSPPGPASISVLRI